MFSLATSRPASFSQCRKMSLEVTSGTDDETVGQLTLDLRLRKLTLAATIEEFLPRRSGQITQSVFKFSLCEGHRYSF